MPTVPRLKTAFFVGMVMSCAIKVFVTTTSKLHQNQNEAANKNIDKKRMFVTTTSKAHHNQNEATNKKRLEFIHIPKTGGSAIEYAAAMANVTWSVCHFDLKKKWCPSSQKKRSPAKVHRVHRISAFHVPPALLEPDDDATKYIDDAELFTVVRDPYDRLLSHYYYIKRIMKQADSNVNDPDKLNSWIKKKLSPMAEALKNKKPNSTSYFQSDGHFIPQYDYVFDYHGEQVIKHVLRFERLHVDFESLMKKYNLSDTIILSKTVNGKQGKHTRNKGLAVPNITIENMRKIDLVYSNDFEAFGYNKYEEGLKLQSL
mmetsp:Transcript_13416/g.32307  ORF Transcript_13416/g.32307 Transcript_13416/m.32307 type:complete len:315 (+) Transcript_13416:66-1010(+)